jgi:AraC-like DNA-binding protein
MNKYTLQPNHIIEQHAHDFVELVYVLDGKAIHTIEGTSYELQAGDVFVIEPNIKHGYTGLINQSATIFNVIFERTLLDSEIKSLRKLPSFVDFFYIAPFFTQNTPFLSYMPVFIKKKAEIDEHFQRLLQEWETQELGYQIVIKMRLIECLIILSRCFDQQNKMKPSIPFQHHEKAIIYSAMELIDKYSSKPINLEQLSRYCGMSVSSFSTKFKQISGNTFIEYKQKSQINKACWYLEQTLMTIDQIADEVGVDDLSYFYRLFKRQTGQTPTQYRKSNQTSKP